MSIKLPYPKSNIRLLINCIDIEDINKIKKSTKKYVVIYSGHYYGVVAIRLTNSPQCFVAKEKVSCILSKNKILNMYQGGLSSC